MFERFKRSLTGLPGLEPGEHHHHRDVSAAAEAMESRGRPCPLGPGTTWEQYFQMWEDDPDELTRRVAETATQHPEWMVPKGRTALIFSQGGQVRVNADGTTTPLTGAQAPDTLDQLKKLGELKQQGVLTDAEFEAQKRKLLGE